MVYACQSHSYASLNKDAALWKELMNPWLINTLIMAMQINIKERGKINSKTYEMLVQTFQINNKKNQGNMISTLIRRIQNKNNCQDLFLTAKLDGE